MNNLFFHFTQHVKSVRLQPWDEMISGVKVRTEFLVFIILLEGCSTLSEIQLTCLMKLFHIFVIYLLFKSDRGKVNIKNICCWLDKIIGRNLLCNFKMLSITKKGKFCIYFAREIENNFFLQMFNHQTQFKFKLTKKTP